MIELEVLGAIRGHTTIHIEDVEPDKRKELAETVQRLLQEGHAIFLIQGEEVRRVQGYDAQSNDWIVFATPQERRAQTRTGPTRTYRARGTRATTVPRTAGG